MSKIMWIEKKSGESGLSGPARIGRVSYSKSGKSIKYNGKIFQSLKGSGFKANYYDIESGDEYWISGCRKDGNNALYNTDVEIDEDGAMTGRPSYFYVCIVPQNFQVIIGV